MSRVLLFSPNHCESPYQVYPLGMAVVAAAAVKAGHTVLQHDYLAAGRDPQALGRAVDSFGPDVIGMSLRNIDDVDSYAGDDSWFLPHYREMIDLCRSHSAAPVVVGGPGFSIMPEEIMRYIGADYGVVGEGEEAFPHILNLLAQGKAPPLLTYGAAPGLDGRQMLSPLLDGDVVRYYNASCGLANLQSKRGCPFRCVYCTYPFIEGRRLRHRDPLQVVDDVRRMVRDHGVEHIFFTDSVFNDAGGAYLTLAEELLRADTGIRWSAFFRPAGIGLEQLRLLRRAGLEMVEAGTDACSDQTLEAMGKGFTFADVAAFNTACAQFEVPVAHFVIFGGPGETLDTVRQGLENLENLKRCVVFPFFGIRILPGTPLRDIALAQGVLDPHEDLLRPHYYYSPDVEVEAMRSMLEASFQGRRDRLFPPGQATELMQVMRRFGYKGLLWDRLLPASRGGRA